jgi:hypothetical protein
MRTHKLNGKVAWQGFLPGIGEAIAIRLGREPTSTGQSA